MDSIFLYFHLGNASQNNSNGIAIKNIKKSEFWRNLEVPPELRSDLLFCYLTVNKLTVAVCL